MDIISRDNYDLDTNDLRISLDDLLHPEKVRAFIAAKRAEKEAADAARLRCQEQAERSLLAELKAKYER